MFWESMQRLSQKEFRRKTGVTRALFFEMVQELKQEKEIRRTKRGKESQFSFEDKILILLRYYREYVTQLSIAVDFRTSESNICRIIKKTEDLLVKSKKFRIPGKKALWKEENLEVVLLDATESEIERPKKREFDGKNRSETEKTNKDATTLGRKKGIA